MMVPRGSSSLGRRIDGDGQQDTARLEKEEEQKSGHKLNIFFVLPK